MGQTTHQWHYDGQPDYCKRQREVKLKKINHLNSPFHLTWLLDKGLPKIKEQSNWSEIKESQQSKNFEITKWRKPLLLTACTVHVAYSEDINKKAKDWCPGQVKMFQKWKLNE